MKTILIADDDWRLTQRNELALNEEFGEGARILIAYNAARVLELAEKYRVDAFVLDILGLDDKMDGVELAELLRKRGYPYPVPIIIASKEKDDTYKNEVHKRIRFFDYITKPYTGEELAWQVKSAVEDLKYRPNPYFEINQGNHTFRTIRNEISHIEKVKEKKRLAVERRDENGKFLEVTYVSVRSFESFIEESVKGDHDLIQCGRTTVVNLYWVERYCDEEKCVILRICGTKIYVTKKFQAEMKRLARTV